MFNINALDIIHLQNSGGDVFTNFVDTLTKVSCFTDGIPLGSIHTNLRNTIADGGVDTRSDDFSESSRAIWTRTKAIWQYKASKYSGGKQNLKSEISKKYSLECIKEGYAYRYCICDSMPVETKKDWEQIINDFVKEINIHSPKAYVLTADDLADWANMFPSVVLKFFKQNATGLGIHLEAWGKSITKETPEYVTYFDWQKVVTNITSQIDLSSAVPDVLLTIQGEAGVGKTRLVYETVKNIEGANGLVIYSNDENNSLKLASILASQDSTKAILIADECSLSMRQKIKSILSGHIDRVRVIAIDNSGERPPDLTYEFWLEKMQSSLLEDILKRNYRYVSEARRRTYAELSGGFVRLAADLCANDNRIALDGHIGAGLGTIREYYLNRLSNDNRRIVEAISLFSKVGFRDDQQNDLKSICEIVNLNYIKVIESAKRIHDVPGFIAIAGRFMYVTPEIICQVAFDEAFKRWVKDDINGFISKLPENMLQTFIDRVAWSGGEMVRRLISDYFRRWILSLSPSDLANLKTVDQLNAIIEADPLYISQLRFLIECAGYDDLLKITGDSTISGRWGPRRYLVWLVERLAAFPEHFYDAEIILRKFALAENEHIGNNATAVWEGLFKIALSGTSLHFSDRLSLLRGLLYSEDRETSDLAYKAFEDIFYDQMTKLIGDRIVGGRLVPEDWAPKNLLEYDECIDKSLELLIELRRKSNYHANKAIQIALKHFRRLANFGKIQQLKIIFSENGEDYVSKNSLIKEIEECLFFDFKEEKFKESELLKKWYIEMQPLGIDEQVKRLVGTSNWHYSIIDKKKEMKQDMENVSRSVLANIQVLDRLTSWLFSTEARNAFEFGYMLGSLDDNLTLLDKFLSEAMVYQDISLTQGYLKALVDTSNTDLLLSINNFFDGMQEEQPEKAHQLYIVGGSKTRALSRTIYLFDKELLLPYHFGNFSRGMVDRELFEDEYEQVLTRLLKSSIKGDTASSNTLYSYVYFLISKYKDFDASSQSVLLEIIWHVLEQCKPLNSMALFEWETVFNKIIDFNPERAASILVNYIGDDDLIFDEHVSQLLIKAISLDPEKCMTLLGEVLLNEKKSFRFFIRKYDKLIQSFPIDVITSWVDKHGVKATRVLARHLEPPYLNEYSEPELSDLTSYILTNYGEDGRTFNEFSAGIHSLQVYSGDIAAKYEKQVDVAKRFLNYPIKAVRSWAVNEIEESLEQAKRWRIDQEEMDL